MGNREGADQTRPSLGEWLARLNVPTDGLVDTVTWSSFSTKMLLFQTKTTISTATALDGVADQHNVLLHKGLASVKTREFL